MKRQIQYFNNYIHCNIKLFYEILWLSFFIKLKINWINGICNLNFNISPLYISTKRNNIEIVKLLLTGAEVDIYELCVLYIYVINQVLMNLFVTFHVTYLILFYNTFFMILK